MVYMETRAGAVYVQMSDLAERYSICKDTVRDRKKGIEDEIESGRYPDNAILEDGKLVLINELVFLDYIKNRKLLKNKNMRKHVKPFNPTEWVPMLGFFSIPKVME